jgi:hypothetical protein
MPRCLPSIASRCRRGAALPTFTLIERCHRHVWSQNMKIRLVTRATALSLSVFLTLVMLGSVDYLATAEPAQNAWMAGTALPRA